MAGKDESAFVKIHAPDFLKARRKKSRLYENKIPRPKGRGIDNSFLTLLMLSNVTKKTSTTRFTAYPCF
jgi:hypothetical protein